MAAALDGEIELVCGAFSSNPEKSKASGLSLGLDPSRIYKSYKEMIVTEKALSVEERMDFVSIVTPNHLHFAPAKMALKNGFHVVCDKPLCISLDEAYSLEKIVNESGMLFALTHNYTGYPMVKQAKAMVKNGDIGVVRKVSVSYSQGWLSTYLEGEDQKQAAWRTDPNKAGQAGALGDIGTHAENLAEYISGLKISAVCADLNIMVSDRRLDDDCNILLKYDNGASGILTASQICAGEENNLKIKISGTNATIEWHQMEPNSLKVYWLDKPMQIYRTGSFGLYDTASLATRLPSGHPEGYIEAFANIYLQVADAIKRVKDGESIDYDSVDFPTIKDGVRGMKFINYVLKSANSDDKWTSIEEK
jgi:predicted dehydrogenase